MVRDVIEYVKSLFRGAAMLITGGVAAALLAAWEHWSESVPRGAYAAIIAAAFFIAAFISWRSERRRVRELENPPEPSDSLRRRTVKLADDIEAFFAVKRLAMPDSEQQAYWNQIQAECYVKFKGQVRSIAQELRSKGVDTRTIPGRDHLLEDMPRALELADTAFLRHLSYRLDHNDQHVRF